MNVILLTCIVGVSIALCITAIVAIRLMLRIHTLTGAINDRVLDIRDVLGSVRKTSDNVSTMLEALEPATQSVREGAEMLHGVARRASRMSETLLDEVETPLSNAVALMHGLRTATSVLMDRWSSRSHNGNHRFNRGGRNV